MVRIIDVAKFMKRSNPTVCVAVKRLEENGYIDRQKGTFLYLTEKGEMIAEKLYERHCFLTEAFIRLGVSKEIAEADACRMEHIISEECYQKIREHFKQKHSEIHIS